MDYVPLEITVDQNDAGFWYGRCPLCDGHAEAALSRTVLDRIVEHMNVDHPEGRVGHA